MNGIAQWMWNTFTPTRSTVSSTVDSHFERLVTGEMSSDGNKSRKQGEALKKATKQKVNSNAGSGSMTKDSRGTASAQGNASAIDSEEESETQVKTGRSQSSAGVYLPPRGMSLGSKGNIMSFV
jgi:hypothetical protein